MRPTLLQIYNDPKAIIAALEAAGVECAHEKVMGMYLHLTEYWSMHRYHKRLDRDRTYTLQSEARRLRLPNAKPDADQWRRNQKQAGEYNKTIIVARGYLRRTAKKLETRIDKWPDLDLDPKDLRKKPDQDLVSKVLKKRMRRGKPRVHVLA